MVVDTLRVVTSVLLKLEILGAERVPDRGPVLLICNHVNVLDPVLACTMLHRYVKGMTAVETFRRFFFRFLAWSVDAIPVERGTPDRTAIRACIETLDKGWVLCIAPEGTRSRHGRMQKGHAGVTLIALRAGADIPIYPVGFAGLEDFWPNLKRLRRTPARVVVGEPFVIAPPQGKAARALREEITEEMMGQIARLVPEKNRGVYAEEATKPPRHLRHIAPQSLPRTTSQPDVSQGST